MEITPTNQAIASAQANESRSLVTSDFETFLRMMTAQIQNQDPLNPMDSTEFATQLATFSGVEQQVRTNDLLVGLRESMALTSMSQMGDWIGMDARAEMPMYFDGEPLSIYATGNNLADRMELIITDELGNTIQRVHLPASDTPIEWAGVTTDGEPLPTGVYGFHVEYFADDTPIETRPAMGYAPIEEAQVINGEVWLSFPGGVQIRSSLVEALR